MRRVIVGVVGSAAALLALGAGLSPATVARSPGGGLSPAIVAPTPRAATFFGTITSATGRYAGDRGHVVVRDAGMTSHPSGRLVVTGRACHGARRCLALNGGPAGTLKAKGHPIPDAGFTYTVHAAGRVAPLGHVTVTGLLRVPGFILCGHQTLTLTFTGARGTVRVSAQERPQCAGGPPAG